MRTLVTELNNTIKSESVAVFEMLSKLGQEMYLPKGIISQSAEAKAKATKYNATIGTAVEHGKAMYLDCMYDSFDDISSEDIFPYAPTTGKLALRKAWQAKQLRENPSMQGKAVGLPIVTNALTHGLSLVADLFCDEGDYIVMPDKYWGNYKLVFCTRRGGVITTFQTIENGRYNVSGLINRVKECGSLKGKAIVVLNFPNNPLGYTPSVQEAQEIAAGLKAIADSGVKIVAVVDDAYFGMFFDDCLKESIFGMLAGISENLLAIKLDGATKEAFAWGLRVGFLTVGAPKCEQAAGMLSALESKVAGCIRGTLSSCSSPSQAVVLKTIEHPDYYKQHKEKFDILKARVDKCKEVLATPKFLEQFEAYPFNSGYFLTLKLKNTDSEALRLALLDEGVGTISTGERDLRIAFSSVDVEGIEELFNIIYEECKKLSKAN